MTSLKHLTIRLPGKPGFDVLETINSTLAYAPAWLIILFIKLLNFYQTLHVLLEDTLFTGISRIVSLDLKSTRTRNNCGIYPELFLGIQSGQAFELSTMAFAFTLLPKPSNLFHFFSRRPGDEGTNLCFSHILSWMECKAG